jgi:hypothetical protein
MDADNAKILATFIPFAVVFLGLAIRHYWLGDKMFDSLATKNPKYYSDLVGNIRARNYLTAIVVRGVPNDFPKNSEARKLAEQSRKAGLMCLACLAIAFVVVSLSNV